MVVKMLTEDGMWQQLFYIKYFKKTLSEVEVKPMNSPFERNLCGLKRSFLVGDILKLEMARRCVFLEDIWLGDTEQAAIHVSK
jgi:hypothetical protein